MTPWNVTIPDEEMDKGLDEKLATQEEADGILSWCVDGALAYLELGLDPPEAVRSATAGYREDQDVLAPFLSERCIEAEEATVRAGELYGAYCIWSDYQKLGKDERLSRTLFGRKMSERFTKGKDNKGAYYNGIGLEERS